MNEIEWTRRVCGSLREMNAIVFAVVGQAKQQPGWPDRYICHKRWRGWVEFKGRDTVVTKRQRKVLRDLTERGDNAVVARFPGYVESWGGEVLGTFDGTGRGLLTCLEGLKLNTN
jgi:hypothetical protein